MTVKYDKFIKELQDLCKKHGVYITTPGYDLIEVWDAEGDRELDLDIIEDYTHGSEKYERYNTKMA